MFVAIMAATLESRVAKYQDFATEVEADTHVTTNLADFPLGFVFSQPTDPISHWFIDMVAQTITISPPPPPDFSVIDQVAIDRLLAESGVLRALAKASFQLENRVRVLEGAPSVTTEQYKNFLKGLMR